VSLIFEALKKLDKEKQAPERGFVVVAPAPWPASGRRRLRWLGLGAGAILLAGLVGFAWWRRTSVPQAAVSPRPHVVVTTPAVAVPAAPAEVASPPPRAALPSTPPQTAPVWQRPPTSVAARPSVPPVAVPPTQASAPPRSALPKEDLQLQAISERDGQPVAMVSGRLVREGDSFDGVRIVKIGPTEVEIEVEGRRRVLRF
jgi:hypothetical protein